MSDGVLESILADRDRLARELDISQKVAGDLHDLERAAVADRDRLAAELEEAKSDYARAEDALHAECDQLEEYLDEHGDPRTLAGELAELRAQIRYLADDLYERASIDDAVGQESELIATRLRALVGPWPHERTETERGGSVGQKADIFVAQPSPIRKDGDPPRSVSGPHEASRGEKEPCLYPLPDGRRCCECETCHRLDARLHAAEAERDRYERVLLYAKTFLTAARPLLGMNVANSLGNRADYLLEQIDAALASTQEDAE